MAKVTVYRCDGCGRIVENPIDLYTITLTNVGMPEDQEMALELQFCYECSADLINTLKRIAECRGNE